MKKKFGHICTNEGYFDHFYFFTSLFKNYKEAYEITEKLHRDNFGHSKYVDYESFRIAKHRMNNKVTKQRKF